MPKKIKTPFCKACGTEMTATGDPPFVLYCPTCKLGCHDLAQKMFVDFKVKK